MLNPRRGGRGPGIAIFLLAYQVFQVGLNHIPPVTLATLGANVAIYLGLLRDFLPFYNRDVCVSVVHVWFRKDWKRLLLSAFYHGDEWHLYYNMISFLWKGISLERKYGSFYLAYLIGVFSVLVNVVEVGLNMGAEQYLGWNSSLTECAVGFSGVIFALKVLTTYNLPPGIEYVMGMFPVHSRLACWVELVVIQLLIPNVSFTGHLAGIIVGFLYVKGPLRYIMDFFVPTRSIRSSRQTYGTGQSGYRAPSGGRSSNYTELHRTMRDNAQNGGQSQRRDEEWEDEDEELQAAIRASLADNTRRTRSQAQATPSAPPLPPEGSTDRGQGSRLYPDLPATPTLPPQQAEELRRRRLARFDR